MFDDNASSSSPMPMARVPVDVFHKILVAVGDDPNIHSACSLVARRWYDVAVPFLFSTIVFNGGRLRPLALLWDFLATHPHLTRFVKELKIRGKLGAQYGWEEAKALTVDFNQLNVSLSQLPILESLFLREVSIPPPPPGQPISGIPLRTICVSDLLLSAEDGVGRMATVYMLLAAYSPHTLLVCDMIQSTHRTLEVDHDVPSRFIPLRSMRIHTVLLDWSAVQYYHQWLEAVLLPDALRHFSTVCTMGAGLELENVNALHSLLVSAGRRLDSLKIEITGSLGGIIGPPSLYFGNLGEAISACVSLRFLHIDIRDLYNLDSESVHHLTLTPFALFESLLSSAPPTLRHVTLVLPKSETPSIAMCDLACLDRPWFRKQCPVLETLHVGLSEKHASSGVESAAFAALPGLHSACILRVTLSPPPSP